jgi:uncharacterized protein YdeI (YjbR/CyaY-like superfamily)
VKLKKTSDFKIPEEFQKKLNKSSKLKTAFDELTPGRQDNIFFIFLNLNNPKTREARVEKSLKQILIGKGLNDE